MSKLEPLFALDDAGAVTEIRGVGVQPEAQVIAVLSEQEGAAPPRDTSWALSAAYEFAIQLQGEQEQDEALDATQHQDPQ